MNDLETLKNYKFIYLATPYTKYYLGQENAANDAAKVVATLLKKGVYVYSSIVHTHQVAIHGNLDLKDHSIWLPFDQPFLDAADLLLVCMMLGWNCSYGVKFEMTDFKEKNKSIIFLNPETLELTKSHNDLQEPEYYGH